MILSGGCLDSVFTLCAPENDTGDNSLTPDPDPRLLIPDLKSESRSKKKIIAK